jgi:hypothetical protein
VSRAAALSSGLKALRRAELHALPPAEKLALLGALALMSFEAGAIADDMAARVEQRADLERQKREEELDEARRKKEERAGLREQAIAALREERAAAVKAGAAPAAGSLEAYLKPKKGSAEGNDQNGPPKKKAKAGAAAAGDAMGDLTGSAGGGEDDDEEAKKAKLKEWTPSHPAVSAKMKELEELEAFGGGRAVPVGDLAGDKAVLEAEAALAGAKAELGRQQPASEEDEEDSIRSQKLSRTQVLQQRKDRDDLVRRLKRQVAQAEALAKLRREQRQALRDIEAALASPGTVPVRELQLLLKAGKAAELEAEDKSWAMGPIRALRRRLLDAAERDTAARKAAAWHDKLGGLLVRREPLATLKACVGGRHVTASFWGFGRDAVPPRRGDDPRAQRLWLQVASPRCAGWQGRGVVALCVCVCRRESGSCSSTSFLLVPSPGLPPILSGAWPVFTTATHSPSFVLCSRESHTCIYNRR